jgi:hypothetical protein
MKDLRRKFIIDNLTTAMLKKDLNDWEIDFIKAMNKKLQRDHVDLTQKEFNKLKEIADR